jgi:tetratricopeptide (TPR) repeat protein/predicted Ser/Thr protein kinase
MIGQTLGRYRILEEIGSGGMGVVYRARDERLERDVALKVLPEGRLGDETARKRFDKEAKALSKLNHPNIAVVHDFDTDKGRDFLVMEHIVGESLEEKLHSGALDEEEVLRLGMQIAEGLAAAHEQGVIHRDIKPGNFRLTSKGWIKILDFGLALLLRPVTDTATTDSALTEAGAAVGTVPYMAPEQLKGDALDQRTDIYGAGAVLYEMATGRRPFPESRGSQLIAAILNQAPEAPREVNPKISPTLERVILKALEKESRRRYPSAGELLEDLERLSSSDIQPAVAISPPSFLECEEAPVRAERPVFVAREEELTKLDELLEASLAGRGRVVFVTGEAGSGKTALVNEFVRRAQETRAELVVAGGNCNAHTGIGDPYLPFREVLSLLTGDVEDRWAAGAISSDQATRLWHTLPHSVRALVESGPDLIDAFVPGRALVERAQSYTTGRTRWLAKLQEIVEHKASLPVASSPMQTVLFEQYSRLLQSLSREKSVLLTLDDLQWADPGSIGLLLHMVPRIEAARILVLGAYRSDEVALGRDGERHPLKPVVNDCKAKFGDIEVEVGRSRDREFVDAYLDTEPNRFGGAFRDAFYQHTEGHSLFTVETLRGMKEQGALVQVEEGRWVEGVVDWKKLPTRVEAMIGERIERLPESLRKVLTVASIEGEYFTGEVLAGVQKADEREMVHLLSGELDKRHHLVRAQGIRRDGGTRLSQYRFRHILFQKYLYNSLDEVERAHLHEDVGTALETLYGEKTEEIAVHLARHFVEAGITDRAILYLQKAGERAVRMNASQEAITHFSLSLKLLLALPESNERDKKELGLQMFLQIPLIATQGWAGPDVGRAAERALELSESIADENLLLPVLFQLSGFYACAAQHGKALELGERMLSMAEIRDDALHVMLAHWAVGLTSGLTGDLVRGRAYFERVLAAYDAEQHKALRFMYHGFDPAVAALGNLSFILTMLGFLDQATERAEECIAHARRLEHPLSEATALHLTVFRFMISDELDRAGPNLQALLREAREHAFFLLLVWAQLVDGMLLYAAGEGKDAPRTIEDAIATLRMIGYVVALPLELSIIAMAHQRAGRLEEALALLDEAWAEVERTGEHAWKSLMMCLRGDVQLREGAPTEAEACFQEALGIARHQKARLYELRAATSLARLWQSQGKHDQAKELLTPVYAWFTEGFDTPPLKEAKALLEKLSRTGISE